MERGTLIRFVMQIIRIQRPKMRMASVCHLVDLEAALWSGIQSI
ncbi:hypothetical protein WH7805_12008 [Synechococcus sp. WH 7805]|nr:hypothetical protein WH7805_12008 [Synechococcus sp. WH 7805]